MKETYLPSFLNVSVSAAYLPLVMISLWNACCISLWCLFEKHAHTITLNSREYTLFHSVGGKKKNWAYTEKDVKTAASGVRVLFFAYRCYMLGAIYLRGFYPAGLCILASPELLLALVGTEFIPFTKVINSTLTIDIPKYAVAFQCGAKHRFLWKPQLPKRKGFRAADIPTLQHSYKIKLNLLLPRIRLQSHSTVSLKHFYPFFSIW